MSDMAVTINAPVVGRKSEKGAIRSYRDLRAWQLAFDLGLRVYQDTRDFPSDERFALTMQLRRGAISIASNISEGYGRGSKDDYLRFLRISRGALYELDTQLLFAVRLTFLNETRYQALKELLDETERVLAALIRSLESASHTPHSKTASMP